MPVLPGVVCDLLRSFDDENIDVGQVAGQISRDQALTAMVLRVANSPFYGMQGRIGTVQEALVVLGFRAVRSMVLGASLHGAFSTARCPGFDVARYVRNSIAVALAARELAAGSGMNRDLAFTAGILHDIGMLVLASCFPERYSQALAAVGGVDADPAREREVLGIDHAEVGGILAEAWHFPQALRDAVRFHHAVPLSANATIADLVHVADIVAHDWGVGAPGQTESDPGAAARLALDETRMAQVHERLEAQIDEALAAFRFDLH